EEPVLRQDAGVAELVLVVVETARGVAVDEVLVGEGSLRVPVQPLGVAVRRRALKGPPVLLGVLAVVALRVGETEEPLLEAVVATVPQRQAEVEEAVDVTEAGQPVLAPAVGPLVRLVEREERPGVAVGGVVLAHGAPLTGGDIRPPPPPRRARILGLVN